MAKYQILSWQEIPAQVRAEDEQGEIELQLPIRFQERIDAVATERGVIDSDEYLDGWAWGEFVEREGTAQNVAEAVGKELEAKFPE